MINASTLRFPILVLSLLLLPFLAVGASEISSSIHNTLPGALHSYGRTAVQSPMSGTYTIANSGGDYATLSAAVTDLNLRGISGPVVFSITAGQTFTEPAGVSITATGTAANTITFQKSGAGSNPIFNFTGTAGTTDYAIRLFGSDYITFNGIEVRDAGTDASNYIEYGFFFEAASGTDGCSNNLVKGCVVDLSKANTSSRGVYLTSTSASSAAGTNSTDYFYNNTIRDAYAAYYFKGSSTEANYNVGNKIGTIDGGTSLIDNIGGGSGVVAITISHEKNFEFYGTTVSNITGTSGLLVYSTHGGGYTTQSIYNNTFTGISASGGGQATGLYLVSGTTTNVYGNVFTNFTASDYDINAIEIKSGTVNVYNNKIHNILFTGTGNARSASGIAVTVTSTANIYNNLIYDIKAPFCTLGSTPTTRGINITAGTVTLYYNTVYLDFTSLEAGNVSAALYVRKNLSAVNLLMKNNSFTNVVNVSTGTRAVAFFNYNTATDFITAGTDNNHFYAGAASAKNLIYYDRTNSDQTIAEYKARMVSTDQHAVSGDPLFQAATYKPYTGSPLLSAAAPIAEVTTDFDAVTRSVTTPTIGAFENSIFLPNVDWCNLQSPDAATLKQGQNLTVYAQVYESGVTEPAGQGAGIQCWIGYSTSNTNPNTWTNWVAATFNVQSGNNDEYKAVLPANLAAGTYYYASRFLREGGLYQYGGYSAGGGGFWNGTANVSGVLTMNDNSITYASLQFPETATMMQTRSATIYGRVYVADVTSSADTSALISAWVGVNSSNSDPSTWDESAWTPAIISAQYGNNDEYKGTIGSSLTVGTYYYATRYKFMSDDYVYGGYSSSGGGFWNGTTNINGTLTVGEKVVDLPYFQNFDQVTAPELPADLKHENTNNDAQWFRTINSVVRSAPNAMHIFYNPVVAMDDWLFTPGFNLSAGTQYQVLFYYMAGGASYPEKLEVKYGASRNSAGMTSTAIFSNTNITNESYVLGSGTFTPASTGTYFIGFHGFSNADMYYLQFDDIDIRVAPSATTSATIPANNTGLTLFGTTGARIQFTTGNEVDLNLTIDKIPANPNGTPPGALLKIAPQYWVVTLTSGAVGVGRYSLTLDITGIPGVTDPATLHLIKRNNAASAWTDMGVPNAVNGNLLTWTGLDSFSEFSIGGLSDNPLPVQLSAFNVTTESRNALLSWETATEENAFKFVVEKKNIEAATWSVAGEVKASGNSNSPKKYNYTDQKLNSGKYNYRLKMIDNDGTFSYSDVVEVDISVPKDYAVSQNYPNPFNPTTKIDYQLPFDSRVQIELYNITGERVATLMNMDQKAGYYTFDFTNTSHLSSGVYIYRIIATGAAQDKPFTAVKKMVMMK